MPNEIAYTADYMHNRELSWLKFNERVLQEANRNETPLLEKLKYISIFTSNLDEFFMVRVGTLTDYALFDNNYRDNKTGMDAPEQLDEIFRAVAPLYTLREQAYSSVIESLEHHDIHLLDINSLDFDELRTLKKYFTQNIMPLLSPQIIGSRHPFPHLANKQMHIAVKLESKKGFLFGLVAVPAEMDRLINLEGGGHRFVLLEDLILYFAGYIFSIYKVMERNIIAVTRNADINTEEDLLDEDIDYRMHMKNILKTRQRLSPVRLELTNPASPQLLAFLCDKLSLDSQRMFYSGAPLDLSFCYLIDRHIDNETVGSIIWSVHHPAEPVPSDKKANMMKYALSGKDILLSYPFESMSPLLSLIRQAAENTSVISIKITLYRIDVQSKLAESLILAAENGKEVIVLMELRARFDEKNNIEWAQRLEEAGCRVIYGPVGYKVHSKVCLITRREFGKIQYITQIGTGNYNEKTAKLYTDLSLITANQELGRDAAVFFSNLLIGNLKGEYHHLWVSPGNLKSSVLKCIDEERRKSVNGEKGNIIIKCNSLTDKEIIEKLAEASCDGVKISMIVRGICCLVPQVAEATENISVISIVGRFLEHSRVFCFGTGAERKIYISSADLMTRNTERRVEVACPVFDPDLKDRISGMLETMLRDNTHAWEEVSDDRYVLRRPPGTDLVINSQELFTQEARLNAIRAEVSNSSVNKQNSNKGLFMINRALISVRKLFGRR